MLVIVSHAADTSLIFLRDIMVAVGEKTVSGAFFSLCGPDTLYISPTYRLRIGYILFAYLATYHLVYDIVMILFPSLFCAGNK